jgi:hypothetical protein
MDRQELVGADSKPAITEPLGQFPEIPDLSLKAIEKDEIIAAAVHLGKVKLAHIALWSAGVLGRSHYSITPLLHSCLPSL